jgi:chromosome segregation ATPase
MAYISRKITEFPATPERPSEPPSDPANYEDDSQAGAAGGRGAVVELEAALREARRNQRLAEDECDRLRRKLSELAEEGASVDVKTLMRERDMLREQQSQYGPVISDLKVRLKAAESAFNAAERERDEEGAVRARLLREKEEAFTALEDLRRKREETVRQRDAVTRQRDLAREEKEAVLEKLTAAEKRFSDAQKAIADLRKEAEAAKRGDGDFANQVVSLRQARDGMAAQIKDLQKKVEELEDQAAELSYACDAAEKESREHAEKLRAAMEAAETGDTDAGKIATLEGQIATLKQEKASLVEAASNHSNELADGLARLKELHAQKEALAQERDAASQALAEARTSLQAAQKQIEAIIRDRESAKQQLSDGMIALEEQIKAQAAEVAQLKRQLADAESKLAVRDEMSDQFEKRRLDMIELTAHLETARREIRILSASLAEARLEAKMAGKKSGAAGSGAAGRQRSASGAARQAAKPPEADGTSAAMERMLEVRRCFQDFSREPGQPGPLAELTSRIDSLADVGRDHGQPVLHRVSVAFASLLEDLRTFPEQISQGTLQTVNQTIELVALLVANPELEHSVALDSARAYVVDDDPATCGTVVESLNSVGFESSYANDPGVAFAALAAEKYDLIILDIHLPDTDGFELCAQIRNLAPHAVTPVFFISGNTSL